MPLDAEAWKLANAHINGGAKSNALADKGEAIRIIRERNGMRTNLGAAAATPDELLQALTAMQTNTQARHVLGIAAAYLSKGYAIAEGMSNLPGLATARKAAKDLLTQARLYAEKVYNTIPDNTAPIPLTLRKQVTIAAKNSYTSLKLVSNASINLQKGMLDDLVDYLQTGANKFLADKGIKVQVPKPLIWAVVGIVGLAGAYFLWKIVSGVMLRGAQLGEAEKAAEAAAEAETRKKRQKQLYSRA